MTVAHIGTVAFVGIEARGRRRASPHVGVTSNKEQMAIVGLADKAVAESRERVRSALHAVGLALPNKRITINLSPADLPKEGSHYDLPIALGLLTAMGVFARARRWPAHVAVGELSLDGAIVPVAGVLPAAIKALELEGTGSSARCSQGRRLRGPSGRRDHRRRHRSSRS